MAKKRSRTCLECGYPFWASKKEHDYHVRMGVPPEWKRNGPIWSAVKRGARVAYHGYRARRYEQRATEARRREHAAWSGNPRTGIPGRALEMRYQRGGSDPGRYVHRYGPNVRFRLMGPNRSRMMLYHAKGQPIWADERDRDFDHWVDVDHRRRRSNPTRRRAMARRRSGGGGSDMTMWLLIGAAIFLFKPNAFAGILGNIGGGTGTTTYPNDTVWLDTTDGTMIVGPSRPGPNWRLATQAEIQMAVIPAA